jgi:hypothetical protein
VVAVDLVQVGRTVRRIGVHAGGRRRPDAVGRVAPVAQADGVPELVAGNVVTAAVILEERAEARVQVEAQLLHAAPAVAVGVQPLRRIARAVDPGGRPDVSVILRVGDDVDLRGELIGLRKVQVGRVVVLAHRVAQ